MKRIEIYDELLHDQFWKRVEQAVADSGRLKNEISADMQVDRKVLSQNMGKAYRNRIWNCKTLARFCDATGVSADWLLGLSDKQYRRKVRKRKHVHLDEAK